MAKLWHSNQRLINDIGTFDGKIPIRNSTKKAS